MKALLLLVCGGVVALMSHAQPRITQGGAEVYPIEITNLRPDLPITNRVSRAYPGLEYNIRAAVIGGVYPYTFSLTDAPSGMVVHAQTGEISWPRPDVAASPLLTVVDSVGTRLSIRWKIHVSTEGFRFVDGRQGRHATANGCASACGTGTFDNPWRSFRDVYTAGRHGEFVYFRDGRYVVTDLPRDRPGSPWERVVFIERTVPVVWLAQPGHNPIIDFSYKLGVEAGPLIRLAGDNVYVDGFETVNSRLIAFQYVSQGGVGPTFRKLRMHGHGPGIDGSNASFILTTTHPNPASYMVIQDSEFWDVTGDSVTIKIYAQDKLLIEDTVHHRATVAIELKDDVRQFTVRGNRIYDVVRTGIGGEHARDHNSWRGALQ